MIVFLKKGIKSRTGRSRSGFIIFRRRGGGKYRQLYRFVDLYMSLARQVPYCIVDLVYDSLRTSYLFLVFYFNGIFSYRVGIDGVKIGSFFSNFYFTRLGNVMGIKFLPEGKPISLVSHAMSYSVFARSAGTFVTLLKIDHILKIALLRLSSGKKYTISFFNQGVFGRINNLMRFNVKRGKAGFYKNLGYKQVVRGIAMNPVDHPNGGRTPGGKVYRSFSNRIARSGKKTANKKYRNIFIKKIYLK